MPSPLATFSLKEGQGGKSPQSFKIFLVFGKIGAFAKRLKKKPYQTNKRSFHVLLEGKVVSEHSSYQTPESPSQRKVNGVS